jgi:hypothetical protein
MVMPSPVRQSDALAPLFDTYAPEGNFKHDRLDLSVGSGDS